MVQTETSGDIPAAVRSLAAKKAPIVALNFCSSLTRFRSSRAVNFLGRPLLHLRLSCWSPASIGN